MVAYSQPPLQFYGIQCPLLASMGTYTHVYNLHNYKNNKNKNLKDKITSGSNIFNIFSVTLSLSYVVFLSSEVTDSIVPSSRSIVYT